MRPSAFLDQTSRNGLGDDAIARARHSEDVVMGDEIVRERLSARVVHWSVALTFFLCLFTGLPIWTSYLGFLANLFGGLQVCRVLHPWMGVAFAAASVLMFAQWMSQMTLTASDRHFITPKGMLEYFEYRNEDADVGKYNGGQKMLFWAAALGALGLLLSGIVMWLPQPIFGHWGPWLRQASYILHDTAFSLFFAMIIGHIYLGTAAEPGTFRSMVRGTVTKSWAQLHHPLWYREVTSRQAKSEK
jgi:formate dehydrogenase subunit gamma